MSDRRGKVGILISGRGSNMVSLVKAMQAGGIPADPAVVVSNVPTAKGLEKAREMGVATEVVDHKKIKPRKVHEQAIAQLLKKYDVDLVCLAGYMRLLKGALLTEYENRIFNIHPALLPAFPGLDVQQAAIDYGAKLSGCTVHFVDEECDHGPIVIQAPVPILEGDTADDLAARILEQEHRIYPEAVKLYFQDRLRIEGRIVRVLPE
jgi:phosphoribosylglycinamide formyltransferase-1